VEIHQAWSGMVMVVVLAYVLVMMMGFIMFL
jgi:hypothetical protein